MIKPLIAFSLLAFLATGAAAACTQWYQIKSGDSCWQIANDNGRSVDKLMADNPGVKCASLHVGDRVCLNRSGGAAQCHKTHKVASGDTCYKIWTQSGVGQRQFMELNANLDCNKLQIGKTVCVG